MPKTLALLCLLSLAACADSRDVVTIPAPCASEPAPWTWMPPAWTVVDTGAGLAWEEEKRGDLYPMLPAAWELTGCPDTLPCHWAMTPPGGRFGFGPQWIATTDETGCPAWLSLETREMVTALVAGDFPVGTVFVLP